jgi:hypothetical protein
MKAHPTWLEEPQAHDYLAAQRFLSLIYDDQQASELVEKLRAAGMSEFAAKDISRASGLVLLPADNEHVRHDRAKVEAGEQLSPLLLVRAPQLGKLIIADGYHRMCAMYAVDEDTPVRCKIV